MLSKERIEQLVSMASFDGDCECVNTRKAIELAANEALASTDTAAQTLREKHYEECAVICEQVASKCQDSTTPEYSLTHHHQWCEGDVCAGKIRVAAKEPK